jgi:hypothetical protein
MIEAEVRMMTLLESGHEPKNAAASRSLERHGNRFSSESPERPALLEPSFHFSLVRSIFKLLISRIVK